MSQYVLNNSKPLFFLTRVKRNKGNSKMKSLYTNSQQLSAISIIIFEPRKQNKLRQVSYSEVTLICKENEGENERNRLSQKVTVSLKKKKKRNHGEER